MSGLGFKVGDLVAVTLEVLAVEPKLKLVLARPKGGDRNDALWYDFTLLVHDHLTPPPAPETAPASD